MMSIVQTHGLTEVKHKSPVLTHTHTHTEQSRAAMFNMYLKDACSLFWLRAKG